CVVGCTSDSRKHLKHGKYPWMKNVIFFPMPKTDNIRNRTIFRRWVKMINRKGWEPTAYTCVCSRHFVDNEPTSANPVPTLCMAPVSGKSRSPKKRSTRKLNPADSSSPTLWTAIPTIDLVDENLDGDDADLALNNDNIVSDQKVEQTAVLLEAGDVQVNEVEVSLHADRKTGPTIGEMSVFKHSVGPSPEHDYTHQSPGKAVRTREMGVQTDISRVEFDEMER
ncbi:unnamed protein product, partial [Owenia fusiformis]